MVKEILLYNPIYSYTAGDFINEMEANKGNDVCVRINCPGGEVFAAMGMIAKFAEHTKNKKVKVDGRAASAAAFMLCYASDVECLDASEFLFHRAAFPSWVEDDKKMFTDDMKASLLRSNDMLRKAMSSKMDISKFEALTGTTLDAMFSLDSRIDVTLNASQAQEVGLVSKVIPLSPAKKAEINAICGTVGLAAFYAEPTAVTPTPPKQIIQTTKNKSMNAAEIKAAHPEAYAEILAAGAQAESTRTKTWLAWFGKKGVDASAIMKGIKEGSELTADVAMEFQVAMASGQAVENIQADNPAVVVTPEAGTDPAPKATATNSILAMCAEGLGLKKEAVIN